MKFSQNILISLLLFATTQLASQNDTCIYQLQLVDFFGDGWDGAELAVIIQEDTSYYTLADSTIGFIAISALKNEHLQLIFSAGAFDEEIRYSLFDPIGDLIFNAGPFPDTGLVLDIIACPTCPIPSKIDINTFETSTILTWEATRNAAAYSVEYGVNGFSRDSGKTVITFDTFMIIPNLTPFTTYDAYLSVFCLHNEGDSVTPIGANSQNEIKSTFTTRYAKDVGIDSIFMFNTACELSNAEMITIYLKNYGAEPQSLIPFRFSVNGIEADVMMPNDGLYTNILSKDSVAKLTFETTYDFSQLREYNIAVWTELAGDNLPQNDTTYYNFALKTSAPLPFIEDFEEETIDHNWLLEGEAEIAILAPDDHNNQSHILAANLWSEAKEATIQTARYGPISANDSLRFDYRFVLWDDPEIPLTLENESLIIEISSDCGQNFRPIYIIDSINHEVSVDFQTIKIDLAAYIGKNTNLRLKGIWGHDDFWLDFDNISIAADSDLMATATNNLAIVNNFNLYPNPTAGFVQLELSLLENTNIDIHLLNHLGQIVFEKQVLNQRQFNEVIDLQKYQAGIYFVKIMVDELNISQKLVIID